MRSLIYLLISNGILSGVGDLDDKKNWISAEDLPGESICTPDDAIAYLKRCRPRVHPNDGFQKQLQIYVENM